MRGHGCGSGRRLAAGLGLIGVVALSAACGTGTGGAGDASARDASSTSSASPSATPEPLPERFRIVPDDYHVPYAGTAGDGRRFFLSQELVDPVAGTAFVGLFLWHADGSFDTVSVTRVDRPKGLPPGQAAPAGAEEIVDARLHSLGDYVIEPIEVEPFLTRVQGTDFGWRPGHYDDGTAYLNIEPGNFIAYYAPWDGLDYDT